MKKRIFLLVLLFSSMMLFAQETEKKDGTDMDIYTISVGFDLKYLKVNDSDYFNFYSDVSATILEVLPIDDNTCKVVIAVPWNRAGSFQNYVIYLKKGDVLQTRSATQVAVGLVGDFQYNLLPFLGLAR